MTISLDTTWSFIKAEALNEDLLWDLSTAELCFSSGWPSRDQQLLVTLSRSPWWYRAEPQETLLKVLCILSAGEWGTLGKPADCTEGHRLQRDHRQLRKSLEVRPDGDWKSICGKHWVRSPILIFLPWHLITVIIGGNDLEGHSHSFILKVVAGNLHLGPAVPS